MNDEEKGVVTKGGGGFGYTPPKIKKTYQAMSGRPLPVITRLVMRFSGGLIKNENQAKLVMVVVSVLFIAVSLFLFFRNNYPSAREVEYIPTTKYGGEDLSDDFR